jgi:hypothetical protein
METGPPLNRQTELAILKNHPEKSFANVFDTSEHFSVIRILLPTEFLDSIDNYSNLVLLLWFQVVVRVRGL